MSHSTLRLTAAVLQVVIDAPGEPETFTITFPSGALAGRTFIVCLDGVTLAGPSIAGDVMTVTFPAENTAAVNNGSSWRLVETTSLPGKSLIKGRVRRKWLGEPSPSNSATVQMVDGSVTVAVAGQPGVGVPPGGTTGQVATKASDDDYDVEWEDPSGGGLDTEAVQDVVGAMATDSATVDFTYDDNAGTLSAAVKPSSVTAGMLAFDPATQVELDAEASARAAADNAHLNDATDAHDASAVSLLGVLATSEVQAGYYVEQSARAVDAAGIAQIVRSIALTGQYHSSGFIDLGAVPHAKDDPTASGKEIHAMVVRNGKPYLGYGNWGVNTGPITVVSYTMTDTATGAGSFGDEVTIETEAIERMVLEGGSIYVPSVDPQGGGDITKPILTVYDGSAWSKKYTDGVIVGGQGMAHVHDVAVSGSRIFVAGEPWNLFLNGNWGAAILQSTDGGATWSAAVTETVGPNNLGQDNKFTHLIKCGDGSIYAQARNEATAVMSSQAWKWNGSTWTAVAPLYTAADYQFDGTPSRPFGTGALVQDYAGFRNGPLEGVSASGRRLWYLDPSTDSLKQVRTLGPVLDCKVFTPTAYGTLFAAVETVFVLDAASQVKFSTDLVNWKTLVVAPPDATSLGVSQVAAAFPSNRLQLWVGTGALAAATPRLWYMRI